MIRGWKRFFVIAILASLYIWAGSRFEGLPLSTFILSTVVLGVLGFIIQYYLKKDAHKKSLSRYLLDAIKELFREPSIEGLIAKRVKDTWIDQYLEAVKTDVKQFDIDFSYLKLEKGSDQKTFFAQIDNQLHEIFNEKARPSSTNQEKNKQTGEDGYKSISNLISKYPRCVILGQAGGGKSILLLHLVSRFVTKAIGENSEDRIPVVLNLSTFPYSKKEKANKKDGEEEAFQSTSQKTEQQAWEKFETWILNRLKVIYGIQKSDCYKLIRRDDLILFLDGLDDLMEDNISRDHINEVIYCMNAFIERRDRLIKNKRNQLSYILACRQTTWSILKDKPSVKKAIIVKPLSNEIIEKVLDIQEGEESTDPDAPNYYHPVILEFIKPAIEASKASRRKSKQASTPQEFALKMARTPYFLNVMRKTSKMRESKPDDVEAWFSDFDEELKELFADYVDSKLNDHRFKHESSFQDDEKALRWLKNMAHWSKGSEFLLEELQPRELLFKGKRPRSSGEKRLFLGLYTGIITLYMIFIVAVPVGISLFYEWNYYLGDGCFESIKSGNWVSFSTACQPGIEMGWSSFLWIAGTLTVIIPITFTFGSMRIPDEIEEVELKEKEKRNLLFDTLINAWKLGGVRFAICLGIALGLARFILIKHSFDEETGMAFDNNAALVNLIVTFFACTVVFVIFSGRGLLREGLYVVKPADSYEIDRKRAVYAILAGLGATLLFLASAVLQYLTGSDWENPEVIFGRALGFGSVLTLTLPLLFAYRPVSDKRIKTKPNHGIKKHTINATYSFVVLFVIGTGALYLGYGLTVGQPSGVVNAICGINFSILALMYGLLSVIRHYSLRTVLAVYPRGENRFPFFAVNFLNHIEKLGLIRKVGGRYLFEHNLLRTYLEHKPENKPDNILAD